MARRVSLCLVLHNHQPVGNFGWVIEEVFERAYEPLVGALERHAGVRLALHYSGPLLEWIAANRPAFIDRLRALVARGQIEVLGGAHFEPILVSLPERDRQGQLHRMREVVGEMFGVAPAGAWLAERVWEPALAADLARAGYRYTVLDDNHLRAATVPEDAMWGTYTTDDEGHLLTVFATEKGLRYRIPWRPVDELIDYLRANASPNGSRLGTMGDDGEKFGGWPGTHELCWGEAGWIDECFGALETNRDWLATVTPTEWLAAHPPLGRVYVPTASYVEMTEWALPPADAREFHRLVEQAEEARSPASRFLRGAMWRNFLARYREVNDLHKQMLRVSDAVDAMPPGPQRDRALDHLYRGQSNDCYWHGLFGGIYIVHMRMATLHHLIAAEDIALGAGAVAGVADYDLDGTDEVMLGTVGQTLLIDVAEGGGIGSWDLRASRVALASVLRRRPEAYHELLREAERAQTSTGQGTSGAVNIHEQVATKEKRLAARLVHDDYERRSGLLRVRAGGSELGDFVTGPWALDWAGEHQAQLARTAGGLTVRKRIVLDGGRLDPTLRIELDLAAESNLLAGELELEWNINLSGGGGNPDAYYRTAVRETRHDQPGQAGNAAIVAFGNAHEGVHVEAQASPPAHVTWYPVETVSNSESGFERAYQGSCLLFTWPLRVAPGETHSVVVEFRVEQSRDRRAEERGQRADAAQRDQLNEGT